MITIIGGDFTRSWLSLPLSHGIKVKGGKNPILGLSRKLIPGDLHVFISGSDFSEPYEFRGLPLIFCDKLLFNWPLSIIWVCLR